MGISRFRRWATEMWLSGESKVAEVGVRTISAPRALRVSTFSLDIFSGNTMMQRYPFTAAAKAMPIPEEFQCSCKNRMNHCVIMTENNVQYEPVFPEVGSIRTSPGLILPAFSASSTIRAPIRSLTLPPALKNSHFATIITKVQKRLRLAVCEYQLELHYRR